MADKLIKVEIKDKEIKKKLKELAEKTGNLRPIMRKISATMQTAVEENFATQGKRLGKEWKDLSTSRKKQRAKIGKWPGQILQVSQGGLASSISSNYTDNEATVGTNKVYAAIHQFGFDGSVSVSAFSYSRRDKKNDGFASSLSTKRKVKSFSAIKFYNVKAHSRKMKMPARPFMGLNDDDLNKILGIVQDELEAN